MGRQRLDPPLRVTVTPRVRSRTTASRHPRSTTGVSFNLRRLPLTHILILPRLVVVGSLWLLSPLLHFIAPTQAQPAPDILKATLAQPQEKTAEVSTEELRRILAEGSASVFDTRPHLEFAISHIPGAVNVAPKAGSAHVALFPPVSEIGRILGGRKDAAIILYCNGPFCGKSKRLAEELTAAGYTNVRRYQLGAPVWGHWWALCRSSLTASATCARATRPPCYSTCDPPRSSRAGSISGARHLPKRRWSRPRTMDGSRWKITTPAFSYRQGCRPSQAAAEEMAKNAFHNVSFYGGSLADLKLASN